MNDGLCQCVLKMAGSMVSTKVFGSILSQFFMLRGITSPISS